MAIGSVLLAAGCSGGTSEPTRAPVKAAEAAAPTPSSTGAIKADLKEFCRGVLTNNTVALDALTRFVEHPDGEGLTVQEFQLPRDNLAYDASRAPSDLKLFIDMQVAVLDQIIDALATGNNRTVPTGAFREASVGFVTTCGEQIQL